MQPGEVIGPGGQSPQEPEKPTEDTQPQPSADVPTPTQTDSGQTNESPEPQPTVEQADATTNWQFTNIDDSQSDQQPSLPTPETITWTASEYLAHDKNAGWYVQAMVASVLLAGLIFFITRDIVSPIVIVIMGAAFATFAARKPDELTYSLSEKGLQIGDKLYPYAQFKSFTIVQEGPHSIMLMPTQRFMQPINVYYDPSEENKIANALSAYLPYDERKPDMVDNLMRRVRF